MKGGRAGSLQAYGGFAVFPMGFTKQNGIGFDWLSGRPQAASMPHRTKRRIHAPFPLRYRIFC